MLDHIGIAVFDYERSKAFYVRALSALGASLVKEVTWPSGDRAHAGFGRDGQPTFWISTTDVARIGPVHVAFAAADHATVDAFHRAALAAGGRDNGAPGPRPHYHAAYYGAFVLDPDGHNVEAVCHSWEGK